MIHEDCLQGTLIQQGEMSTKRPGEIQILVKFQWWQFQGSIGGPGVPRVALAGWVTCLTVEPARVDMLGLS